MPRVGFELTISAGERPKIYVLDRAATGTGIFSNWENKIDCALLPKKKGMIPPTCVDCNAWGIPEGLMLVDEKFNNRNSIDFLLGADVFFEFLCHDQKTRPGNYPVLQDRDLGWIISGKILLTASEEVPRKSLFFRNSNNLDQQLQRFWGMKNCLVRHEQLKKFCVKNTSRNVLHEMI